MKTHIGDDVPVPAEGRVAQAQGGCYVRNPQQIRPYDESATDVDWCAKCLKVTEVSPKGKLLRLATLARNNPGNPLSQEILAIINK